MGGGRRSQTVGAGIQVQRMHTPAESLQLPVEVKDQCWLAC
jgi:hypothetical protein